MHSTGLLPISGVIITLNEEDRILDCILSLQQVCAEVIVVDSFSSDQTPEICKKAGVRFVQCHWKGFSDTKNFANTLAKHPYILSLDSDERLSPTLIKQIQSIDAQKSAVYSFNRLNFYRGVPVRYCGWYPDTKIRLFPKDQARWVGIYVHEKLEYDKDLPLIKLRGDLLHFTIRTAEEHRNTIFKYADLAAKEWLSKHPKPSVFKPYGSYLAMFIKKYLLQFGFLDGANGLLISHYSGLSRYLRYSKARTLKTS
jgi:glycosyltransferase involved in cell wall biosynthesis